MRCLQILYRFNMYISTYIYLININCEDWTEGLHLSFNQSIGPIISSRSVNRNLATGQMWPNHVTLFNLFHISKFDRFDKERGKDTFSLTVSFQLISYTNIYTCDKSLNYNAEEPFNDNNRVVKTF